MSKDKKVIKYGEYYASSKIVNINLEEIEEIGESAFASSLLESVTGVIKNANNFAFSVCEKLSGNLQIGGKKVGRAAFERCPYIKEIFLMDDVLEIDGWAFDECESLGLVRFPDKLNVIGEEAFHSTGIENLSIGEVDTICSNAFSECGKLKTVEIKKINKSMKSNAFSKCTGLKNIIYNGDMVMSLSENQRFNRIIQEEDTFFIEYDEISVNEKEKIDVIRKRSKLPDFMPVIEGRELLKREPIMIEGKFSHNTKHVPDGILRGCKKISEIELDSVENIGNNAFDRCSNLSNVKLSDSLRKMGKCAFQDSGIQEIDLSKTQITSIEGRTFHVCRNLKNIILPEGLEKIDYFGIAGCTSLENLKLPNSVRFLGKAALARNIMLKSVNIPECLESIPEYALMGCINLESLHIPDNVTTIGDKAFSLSGISKITLPKDLGISESIFDGCKNLREIIVGDEAIINLKEGENFTRLQKEIKEDGEEMWFVFYEDESGKIHKQLIDGLQSIEKKNNQKFVINPNDIGKRTINISVEKYDEAKDRIYDDVKSIKEHTQEIGK